MSRINKALERMKNASGNTTAPVRSVPVSDMDADHPDIFEFKLPKVRLDRKKLNQNRIITDDIDPTIRTAYKMLRTRVLQRMKSNGWCNLAVTSATQGDGKTVTAINLALSIAGDVNHTVCLVDLDLRHSSVADYLGLKIKNGISDCLLRNLPLNEAMLSTPLDRLRILPNHRTEVNSSEVISSPKMGTIAQQLGHANNRIVIYDMPPVLAADDMLAFSPLADAILLVVAEGKTTRTDVMKSNELLDGTEIIGTVLNRSDEKTASYY